MGLDMYLEKRQYVKNWDFMKPEEKHTIVVLKGGEKQESAFPVSNVIYEVGYWRKANAIHKWFVDNCADGIDNCQDIYVEREQLQELLDLCEKVKRIAVLDDGKVLTSTSWNPDGTKTPNFEEGHVVVNAEEVAKLLPTTDGFFFGGTDYDEWYVRDIDDTIEILTKALAEENDGWTDFYYRASW